MKWIALRVMSMAALSVQRTVTFANRKVLIVSTPRVSHASIRREGVTTCRANTATQETRDFLSWRANSKTIEGADRVSLDRLIEKQRASLFQDDSDDKQAARMSAEINGLLRAGLLDRIARDAFVLLHTDTALGRETAKILEAWLRARACGYGVRRRPANGQPDEFQGRPGGSRQDT